MKKKEEAKREGEVDKIKEEEGNVRRNMVSEK